MSEIDNEAQVSAVAGCWSERLQPGHSPRHSRRCGPRRPLKMPTSTCSKGSIAKKIPMK